MPTKVVAFRDGGTGDAGDDGMEVRNDTHLPARPIRVTCATPRHLWWRLLLVTGAEGAIGDGLLGRECGLAAWLARPIGPPRGQNHPAAGERVPAQFSHDQLEGRFVQRSQARTTRRRDRTEG